MSVVFVVDSDKSALYTAACARTEVSGGSVVVANQFSSPNSLLIFLLKKKFLRVVYLMEKLFKQKKVNGIF